MKSYEKLAKEVRLLIGDDKTQKAIELLIQEEIDVAKKELIILKGRFSKLKRNQLSGTIAISEATLEYNKINDSLLNIADEIEKYSKVTTPSSLRRKNYIWLIPTILVLAIVVYALVFFIESKDRKAWEESKDLNTIPAYKAYITNFPEGDSIAEAQNNIKQLEYELNQEERDNIMSAWKRARNLNTVDSYKTFINSYPNADSISNASFYIKRIEDWKKAIAIKSFDSMSKFYSMYPKYDSIRFRIEELKPIVEKKFMTFFRFDESTEDVFGKNNCKASVKSTFNVDRYNSDNKALDLDGKKDYLKASNLVFKDVSSNRYSISLWVYFPRHEHGGTLFGQFPNKGSHGRKNHYTELYPKKLLIDEFLPGGRHLDSKLSLSARKWNHIVIARDLQFVFFYLNGEKIKTYPYVEKYTDDGLGKISEAYIGATIDSKGQMTNHFTGIIDDLGFIESTLSESEVKFIYAVQKNYKD